MFIKTRKKTLILQLPFEKVKKKEKNHKQNKWKKINIRGEINSIEKVNKNNGTKSRFFQINTFDKSLTRMRK